MSEGFVAPAGEVTFKVKEKKAPFGWRIRNFHNLWRGLWRVSLARLFHIPTYYGSLRLVRHTPDGAIDYGVVSYRVVTDAFVAYVVDALQADVTFENFKYHAFGTSAAAEAAANTGLTTELTTQYVSDNTRPTGTQGEGAANVYVTVGTLDPDAAVAITEHAVMLAASGATTCMDRSVFSAINLAATGDTLEATYSLTLTSGS